jgi:hypothetical protein
MSTGMWGPAIRYKIGEAVTLKMTCSPLEYKGHLVQISAQSLFMV